MARIGLVLSGGMAKGAYQIGALKAIQEFFEKKEIVALSSASIGVLNAFAYVTDSIDKGVSFWKNLICNDKKIFISTVLKSDYLQNVIKSLTFENRKIKQNFFSTILFTDEKELRYIDFSKESVEDYQKLLQASVALPLTNKAVELHGKRLFDGAIIDNIPVKPFLNMNLDLIICLYFEEGGIVFENDEFDSKIIKIVFKNKSIIRDSVCFERKKVNDMLREGYSFTKEKLLFYFHGDKDNIQSVKEKIRMTNEENKDRKPRKTGDFVVREFNKLMKHFVKQS